MVDEFGFAPLDAIATQLLFRFIAAAYGRRSMAGLTPPPRELGTFPARAHLGPSPTRPASAPSVVVTKEGEFRNERSNAHQHKEDKVELTAGSAKWGLLIPPQNLLITSWHPSCPPPAY